MVIHSSVYVHGAVGMVYTLIAYKYVEYARLAWDIGPTSAPRANIATKITSPPLDIVHVEDGQCAPVSSP